MQTPGAGRVAVLTGDDGFGLGRLLRLGQELAVYFWADIDEETRHFQWLKKLEQAQAYSRVLECRSCWANFVAEHE